MAAARDFPRSWRNLALTDLAYKAVAFALLTPGTALLLRWIMSGDEGRVLADADILRFFITTRVGVLTLFVGGAIFAAITALETACLMAIGRSAAADRTLHVRGALMFGATRAARILALTGHMVLRVFVGLLPFLLLAGAIYWGFLRKHDINYYLAERPRALWAAAVSSWRSSRLSPPCFSERSPAGRSPFRSSCSRAIFALGLFPQGPLAKTELASRDYQQRVLGSRLPEAAP